MNDRQDQYRRDVARATRLFVHLPVLLRGEPGAGKTHLARQIWREAGAPGRFVSINLAVLPSALIESELFGHVRGAYTGAAGARQGLLSKARGGCAFLDEIGELALDDQGKLLDFLERGVIKPVGADEEKAIECAVICATNRDLAEMVREGAFREDLWTRLSGAVVELPPLRETPQRVEAIARAALPELTPEGVDVLKAHHWMPGNVRALLHVLTICRVEGHDPITIAAEIRRLPGHAVQLLGVDYEVLEIAREMSAGGSWFTAAQMAERLGCGREWASRRLTKCPGVVRRGRGRATRYRVSEVQHDATREHEKGGDRDE